MDSRTYDQSPLHALGHISLVTNAPSSRAKRTPCQKSPFAKSSGLFATSNNARDPTSPSLSTVSAVTKSTPAKFTGKNSSTSYDTLHLPNPTASCTAKTLILNTEYSTTICPVLSNVSWTATTEQTATLAAPARDTSSSPEVVPSAGDHDSKHLPQSQLAKLNSWLRLTPDARTSGSAASSRNSPTSPVPE